MTNNPKYSEMDLFLQSFLLVSIDRRLQKMDSNIGTNENQVKLTITEYSTKHKISSATVRNWIKAGKVEFEMVKGKYFIFDYEVATNTTKLDTNVASNDLLLEKDNLIQSLQEQIEIKDSQINELLQQQNQNQQIIMSMNQNQKLLFESKRTWLQRLFGLNVESV